MDDQTELDLHHLRHNSRGDSTLLVEVKKLKTFNVLALASLAVVLLLFCLWHWQFMLCAFLLLAPSTRLVVWWQKNQALCPLDHVVSSYFQGFYVLFTVSTGSAFVALIFASLILESIFFGMTGDSGYDYVFWIVEFLRWGVFVFVEEVWKTTFLRWAKIRRQHRVGGYSRAHAVSGAALALGYATTQSLLLMIIVTAALESNGSEEARRKHEITGSEFGWMIFFSLLFGLVAMPLNIMCTYLEGSELNNVEGDDDGACCPCGFPPGGPEGIKAFCWMLRWPVFLRTIFLSQFIIWLVVFGFFLDLWLVALLMMIISTAAIYIATYQLVKSVDRRSENDHDVYRSVYGFQLLTDEDSSSRGQHQPLPTHAPSSDNPDGPTTASGLATPFGSSAGGGGESSPFPTSSARSPGEVEMSEVPDVAPYPVQDPYALESGGEMFSSPLHDEIAGDFDGQGGDADTAGV